MMDEYEMEDCDPSGEGCENCPRYMDDCDCKDFEAPEPADNQNIKRRTRIGG